MNLCFIIPALDHYKYFFSDINENETVITLHRLCHLMKRIDNSVHSWWLRPLVYYATLCLISLKIDFKKTDCICITDLVQKSLPYGFIRWLRNKYRNKQFVILLYNKVSTMYGLNGNVDMDELYDYDAMLPFDKIFSYDLHECARFGFQFFIVVSDITKHLNTDIKEQHDLFYCGSIGKAWKYDRYTEIDRVYRHLAANGVDCDFRVVFDKSLELPDAEYATYDRMTYIDMISKSLCSRAILDIVSNNKNGITLRFYEALIYNKKYITNNPVVLEHPLFDSRFMRVFADPLEIDIDWLLRHEKVDYQYDNMFSPQAFHQVLLKQ